MIDKKTARLAMKLWIQKHTALERDLKLCNSIEAMRRISEESIQELKRIKDTIHKIEMIQDSLSRLSGTQALRKNELERRMKIATDNIVKYKRLYYSK